MLERALAARLPLITVTTSDTINVFDVVEHLVPSGDAITVEAGMPVNMDKVRPLTYYVCEGAPEDLAEAYGTMVAQGSCLILINPDEPIPAAFDAGEVPVPRKMVEDLVADLPAEDPEAVVAALGGLTIKEVGEVVSLAPDMRPETVLDTRRRVLRPSSGLEMVDTQMDYYVPDAKLRQIARRDRKFLIGSDDLLLRPRGMLLSGLPGTGKTSAAKWLASAWDLPLYRLDVGAAKSKWEGETDRQWRAALARVERDAPCLLLIDEVEKEFRRDRNRDDANPAMLGYLLWWLQEHRARVFTVMTTNDAEALPPELSRGRRLDYHVELAPFYIDEPQAALDFVGGLVSRWPQVDGQAILDDVDDALAEMKDRPSLVVQIDGGERPAVSHADLTETVIMRVRDAVAE